MINAAIGLFELKHFVFLWKMKSFEFIYALACFSACFFLTFSKGILVCIAISVYQVIRRSTIIEMTVSVSFRETSLEENMTTAFGEPQIPKGIIQAKRGIREIRVSFKGKITTSNIGSVRRIIEMKLAQNQATLTQFSDANISRTLFICSKYLCYSSTLIEFDFLNCAKLDLAALSNFKDILAVYFSKGWRVAVSGLNSDNLELFQQSGVLMLISE